MSRLPNTTATWARPNDKHWCNVCKAFVDGHPNKIRQHEAAGRHQNNMRQQMKALKRREFDQRRLKEEKETEIRSIEQAAVAALHADAHAGYIGSGALAAGGNYLFNPVSIVATPHRAGPQVYKGPKSDELQQQIPFDVIDDRFPEHKLFSAEAPAPLIVEYVRRANVEVDEATGLGVWESVPVEEQMKEVPAEDSDNDAEPPLPNPDMAPVSYTDIDEFTEREQIAELENDYGLPAIRILAQNQIRVKKRDAEQAEQKEVKPVDGTPQKIQFSFKKRRKQSS